MFAVIVCNITTVALLIGLFAGLIVGFIDGRIAIADALAFDAHAGFTPQPDIRSLATPRRA